MGNRSGLTVREAFRGFGERKAALQMEVGIDSGEWEILGTLDEGPLTETQLSYNWGDDHGNLHGLLSGLVGKGYIAAEDDPPRPEPFYAITERGSVCLTTLRERYRFMLRERLDLVDPVKLLRVHRVFKTFMAQNGITLKPRLRRFH